MNDALIAFDADPTQPIDSHGADVTLPPARLLDTSSLREKLRKLSSARAAAASDPPAPQHEGGSEMPGTGEAADVPRRARVSADEPAMGSRRDPKVAAQAYGLASLAKSIQSSRIMIVDDEETNVLTVQAFLRQEGYHEFLTTTDARDALDLMKANKPDVVLLDIKMPHVSGLELLRMMSLDSSLRHIPSLVLTAATDPEIKQQALDLGANDFLTKPVDPHDLVPRVRNALVIKLHLDDMTDQNAKLESLVRRRTEDLSASRQQLILSLAKAAEHRDDDTRNHVIRVGRYAGVIARKLGWTEQRIQMIEQAAQLHDVGKIGIPDAILFKKGKLDPQEWDLMKQHCVFGKEIIEPFSEHELNVLRSHARLGADILHIRSSPMMMMATRIAQTHHERWDGSGYPLGLAGEDIPIEGRITAVADVYDALSTERSYKKAFPREKCFEILRQGRGAHFDPTVLDAFFASAPEIIEIQLRLMDCSRR